MKLVAALVFVVSSFALLACDDKKPEPAKSAPAATAPAAAEAPKPSAAPKAPGGW